MSFHDHLCNYEDFNSYKNFKCYIYFSNYNLKKENKSVRLVFFVHLEF